MEYIVFFLIASAAVGAILYFVIEDIKIKKDIQEKKRKLEEEKEKESK